MRREGKDMGSYMRGMYEIEGGEKWMVGDSRMDAERRGRGRIVD